MLSVLTSTPPPRSPSLPLQLNSTHQQQQQLRAARSLIVNNLGHSAAVSQSVALLLLLLLLRFALFHCRHAAAAFFKHATPPLPTPLASLLA